MTDLPEVPPTPGTKEAVKLEALITKFLGHDRPFSVTIASLDPIQKEGTINVDTVCCIRPCPVNKGLALLVTQINLVNNQLKTMRESLDPDDQERFDSALSDMLAQDAFIKMSFAQVSGKGSNSRTTSHDWEKPS